MELNELEQAVRKDFTERKIIIDNDTLGKRPRDIAYQIAWNLYHMANDHQPIYPQQAELMQRLGYAKTADELTEQGRNTQQGLSKSGYYVKEGLDLL